MQRFRNIFGDMKNRISANLRREKLKYVLRQTRKSNSILDVGVWTRMPEPHPQENFLEKQAPPELKLICLGLEPMGRFLKMYPNVICVQGDGRALPFKNATIDFVLANAVLEHIGGEDEILFVREITRVAKNTCFLTVPDRFCPVEVHSNIPFLHWLPCWRFLFRMLGKGYWGNKANLNLFTKKKLSQVLGKASPSTDWTVKKHFLGMVPISLIAIGRVGKEQNPSQYGG